MDQDYQDITQNSKVDVWTHGKQNIIGVVFCFLLFCLGFFFSGNIGLYLNLAGLIIVVGGTCTAVLLGFRMERVKILFKVISASYTRPAVDSDTIVKILVDLSIKRKIKGILSLEKKRKRPRFFFCAGPLG